MPVRWGGVVLVGVALITLAVSREESDRLLEPIAFVALVLVAAAIVVVSLTTLIVRSRLKSLDVGVPPELTTGAEFLTGFRVPNVRALGLLDVELEWVEPRGFEVELVKTEGTLGERVRAVERGRHDRLVRRFTVEDVFGIAALSFELEWELSMRVIPVAAPVRVALSASFSSGDSYSHPSGRPEGDLIEMRAYAHGDSMRHVLWRTFARTRRLLVRIPERAVAPRPINVGFLLAGQGDEATAGVARIFLEQGLLGADFVFAADGATQPTTRTPEAVEQIIDSVKARAPEASTVQSLANLVQPHRLGACVVFAPPLDGPWRTRLLELTRRLGVQATVIIGTDEVDATSSPRPRVASWLLEDVVAERAANLSALRASLEAEGLTVQLIHRPTGRSV